MAKKNSKKGKKSKGGAKNGSTKFGRIYGSEVGKGKSNDEAAAIAYYYTDGKESLSAHVDLRREAEDLREMLSRLGR